MKVSLWTSSGQAWPEIVTAARLAADLGWHGVWVPDHFMPTEDGYGAGRDGDPELAPVHEAWTLASAIGASVAGLRVGVLVSGNTYRHPAVVAKMATTLDHVTAGRAVLGLGASWQANEHRRYGIPFGTATERAERLEEAAAVITGLFTNRRTTFVGRHYTLDDAPLEPKPIQRPLPLLIGGGGERTLATAARWAQVWNIWGTAEDLAATGKRLDRRCVDLGREPRSLERTACAFLQILDDPVEAAQRRERAGRKGGLIGTPDELPAMITAYTMAGVTELIIPDYDHTAATREATLTRFTEMLAEGSGEKPAAPNPTSGVT